jgi:uncharacterized membrane protein YphA (DoxX/SURF4 family)
MRNPTPFALAGIAVVGVVLDQIDVPHDNAQGVLVLTSGAAAGALAGLFIARSAKTEDRSSAARRTAWLVVRLFLAFEMVRYGMPKILGMQFYPQYWKLDMRPVEMKPSWLAWTFFGRTYGYQAIGGVIETIGGALLCFRRTTMLGACLLAVVLADVVLVNFFYDVPVKLFSSVYLAMTVALIARDAPRVWAFLFPNARDEPIGKRALAVHAIVIALVLGLGVADAVHDAVRHHIFRVDVLEGAWNVDRCSGVDDVLPNVPGTWERIYFEKGNYGFVRVGPQRVRVHFETEVDEPAHTLRLRQLGQQATTLEGTFEIHEHTARFAGSREGRAFSMELTREFPR